MVDSPRADGSKGAENGPAVAPHPVLEDYYSDERDRPGYLKDLFDASAKDYDWINSVMSLGTGTRYRRAALLRAGLAPGMHVLDLACGTGVISELAWSVVGREGRVLSVDPSPGMRAEALRKRGIESVAGQAEALPTSDDSIDFLVMGYALRHVHDLRHAFSEMRRVLRPGGRVLLLEITEPSSGLANRLLRVYMRRVIPTVARLGSLRRPPQKMMTYLWDSIEHCVPPAKILEELEAVGFANPSRYIELGIFSEYVAQEPQGSIPQRQDHPNGS